MSSNALTESRKREDKDYRVVPLDESCHDPGQSADHGHARGRGLGHMAMMVLCCAAPIILLSLLPLLARVSPAFGGILWKVAPFLCPIMMILMLPMMLKDHKHRH